MAKGLLGKFRHTIGYLLFKKIFFAYIFIIFIITSYQIFHEYNFAKKIITQDLINSEESFSISLAKAIWQFDEKQINIDANIILNTKKISGILILSANNEIFLAKGLINKQLVKNKSFLFKENKDLYSFEEDLLSHSFTLIDEINSPKEVLGKTYFFIDKKEIFVLTKESVLLILIDAIISALVLWFLFVYFANKLLTKPLNQLIEATSELDVEKHTQIEISLNTDKKHELNTLIDTFNNMSKRINESYINMQQLTMIQDKQKKDLQNANKSRDDFLANMSHELKTPLNSINVISSVMMKNKKEHLSEKDVDNLKIINSCGKDLLYLINDVLDISKLEAGEVELEYKQINFKTLMEEIKAMFEPQVKQKGLNFIFSCDESINDVYTDDNRIKQIIKNLLSNALKFVNKGCISYLVKDEDDKIRIDIIDDGIGIEENKLEHIFDRFKQADGSTTRKYGGTGLGLAICKDLLDLLEGSIKVTSKINEGSKFTIIIPKNLDKVKLVSKKEIKEKSKEKSILLLNNDPVSFLSLVVELRKNFILEQSSKLLEFLQLYKQNPSVALLLIDISNEKEEEILKVLKIFKNKKIILIHKEELSQYLKDFNLFCIQKPIDKELLSEEINKILKV